MAEDAGDKDFWTLPEADRVRAFQAAAAADGKTLTCREAYQGVELVRAINHQEARGISARSWPPRGNWRVAMFDNDPPPLRDMEAI